MMAEDIFAEADIIFADPERQIRNGIRQILMDQGYRRVRDYSSLEIVGEELERSVPDVIVMDAKMNGGAACALTESLRQRKVGSNPFTGVIITVWEPNEALIRRIVNCGADDVMVKPISPKQVMARINMMAFKRKPFVVTSDYIGPDRRGPEAKERDGQDVPVIDVPNTLEAKAKGQPIEMDSLIKMPAYAKGNIGDETKTDVIRLAEIAAEVGGRLRESNFATVAAMCVNMITVTTSIRQKIMDPDPKDVALLKPLSDAILVGFNPGKNADAMAGEIGSILDKISDKKN